MAAAIQFCVTALRRNQPLHTNAYTFQPKQVGPCHLERQAVGSVVATGRLSRPSPITGSTDKKASSHRVAWTLSDQYSLLARRHGERATNSDASLDDRSVIA